MLPSYRNRSIDLHSKLRATLAVNGLSMSYYISFPRCPDILHLWVLCFSQWFILSIRDNTWEPKNELYIIRDLPLQLGSRSCCEPSGWLNLSPWNTYRFKSSLNFKCFSFYTYFNNYIHGQQSFQWCNG